MIQEQKTKFMEEIINEESPRPIKITTERVEETVRKISTSTIRMDKEMVEDIIEQKLQELWEKNQITRVIKIRDTSYQECKERINALVHEHKSGITTMEIAERLNVDPELVLKILSELKEEGKIGKINEGD